MAEEKKKRRGRPKEDETKEEDKPQYSHESKLRCTTFAKSHPRFLGVRCDAIMRAEKTINGGKIKQWKCPKCGWKTQTEGKLI